MRTEHGNIVRRLREQLRVTQSEPLPKRWVELIILLNERERAVRDRHDPSADPFHSKE